MGKKANYTIPQRREREPVKPAYSALHILSAVHLDMSPAHMGELSKMLQLLNTSSIA